ncbi:Hypothetical Protein FCC1311_017472 [Hondaea fermentalgiana]|uniref:Sulfotransferase domain-containing protein n=1 Tax=Hondaea fermentalgiana TaxID=2315210 RepID=A0A2R5G6V7_9STRA|nr:Hypothetical Protein FCC1311_017472 [Hondaea fermentalgiana]|eukprot:GBG25528.1 Hypothetical Protein FCC1311_017472 [Hondaea fermentalgiana]
MADASAIYASMREALQTVPAPVISNFLGCRFASELRREKALFDANCNLNNRPDRLTLAAGTAEDFSAVVDKFRDEENRTFLASEWFLPAQLPKRQDIKYITMLRDPLARMESHFHMAFEQAARALKSSPKKICRYVEFLPSWQTIRLIDEDMEVATCAQVPFGKLTEEHFQIAKDRLENDFAIVGIIEHFQETITMFHGLLQWDGEVSDIFSEHHGTHHGGNTVLKRLELEAAGNPRLQNFAKWWHAVNQFDIRLYNIGRELFRKQATAEGLQVEMGLEVSLDFVAPQGEVTPAAALRSMLEADVNTRKCTTQSRPLKGHVLIVDRVVDGNGVADVYYGESGDLDATNAELISLSKGKVERVDSVLNMLRRRRLTFVANEWMLSETLPSRDDVTYLTMLRNPLARTESHYAMAMTQTMTHLRNHGTVWRCKLAEGVPSTRELAQHDDDLNIASRSRIYFAQTTPDNWQTRAICGPPCAQVPYGQLTEEHLAIAKTRLTTVFEVVGILEHFHETMSLMHDHLLWKKDASKVFEKHKGTHHGGLTVLQRVEQASASQPHLLEFAKWFHATNQFDIELYNFGRTLFKMQAQARGISVDLGPDVDLDFVSPNQRLTTSAELKVMLADYVREKGCRTQCCEDRCGPIGQYWYRSAETFDMVPPRKRCSPHEAQTIHN